MPSAPLFYQPLVMARVLTTPLDKVVPSKDPTVPPSMVKTTVYDEMAEQSRIINEAYTNPKYRGKMDGIMRGFEDLQAGIPGSKSLDHIQFSFDETGYVANRINTFMRLHQSEFDTASPDQAAEMGAKLVLEAQKELKDGPGMRAVGDTLEVAPDMSATLRAHWEGEKLSAREVAEVGVVAGRELQRSVTPLEPDATHPQLQWIEDGTMWMLGMWPGAASRTAEALGLVADTAEVEKFVDGWRGSMLSDTPDPETQLGKVAPSVKSLTAILGAAGINGDAASEAAAFQVLQGAPLEAVPMGIAQAIVATKHIPAEATEYVAKRIVETTGSPGNVTGLIAELEQLAKPAPVDPPPGEEPPPVDPPNEEPPPPGPPMPEPPPGEPAPDPVDPPKDPDPKPEPKPEPTPDPKPEPKPDPTPDPKPAEQQVVNVTGGVGAPTNGGRGKPMSDEDFAKLLASVRAEMGPHPADDLPVDPPS